MMPVANAVPLKAVCALEEVADSCGTDLGAKATQRSVAPARLLANATRAVLGTVRRSAVLNTRHSVRSVPGRSVVVYEVARGFSDGQEFATSINVANEGSVTVAQVAQIYGRAKLPRGVSELNPCLPGFRRPPASRSCAFM